MRLDLSLKNTKFTNFWGWFCAHGAELLLLIAVFFLSIYADSPKELPVIGRFSCPFHKLTGYSCAGCGISRAFIAIGHAEFTQALRLNPLAFILFPFLLFRLVKQFCATFLNKYPEMNVPVLFYPVAGFLILIFFAGRLILEISGSIRTL